MQLKKQYRSFGFALLLITLSSCYKKALTDFTTDKDEYRAGESVIIENRTKNVTTFRWTLTNPLGNVLRYSEADPKIKLNPCAPDGDYSLTLQGATQKGRSSSATRKISVKTIRGYLYIFNSVNFVDTIEIKADGESIGKLYNGGTLEIKIATGTHFFTAGNGSKTSLTIEEDGYYTWNVSE